MLERTSARWPLLVAAVAVLVHLDTLGNGFALDDVALVAQNPAIASPARIPRLLVEPYADLGGGHAGLYRPATTISLAINRALTGAAPFGFHLGNVLLHAGVAALAWAALRRAATHYGTALAGAMLFAVHPLHTEAVANVAGRAELLAALFVLSAWVAWRHAGESARPGRWRAASAAFYLLAILAKEGAILAPVLFIADDAMRDGAPAGIRAVKRYAAFAAALAVALGLRLLALGSHQAADSAIPLDNPAAAAGTLPRVSTALWVQVKYALLCLWPHPLSADYSFDAIPIARSLADPRALAGLAFLGVLATTAIWGWRHSRPLAIAALLWAVFFLPSSNLFFGTGTIMAERLAYLPSLGVALFAGHAAAALAAKAPPSRRRLVAAAVVGTVGVVAAILAAATWNRNPAWKDNLTLATTDVATQPGSAKLQAGAGIFLASAGRDAEAEDHLRRAVAIYPDYAQAHYNLAVVLNRRGARDEALAHLRTAVALAPENASARRLLDQWSR